MRRRLLLPPLLSLLLASTAFAQSPNERSRELNRQAIEAYHELNLDRAEELLIQAQQECETNSCTPNDRARTLANQGIVAYGGHGEPARALELFRQACTIDPNVQLDPMLSTPDVDMLFQRARSEAAARRTAGSGGVDLIHTAPPEQLVHTGLPLYVEVPDEVNVTRMELHYLGNGMRRYATLAMQAMVDGFGVELACEHVFAPSISYYFVAYDNEGRTIRTVGSEQQPFRVPIVTSRRHPAPALPGRVPPESCSLDECPPNMDCSHGTAAARAAYGESCTDDAQCQDGLTCENGACGHAEASSEGAWERYWVEAGVALTWARGRDGMRAASNPSGGGNPQTDADTTNDSWIQGGTNGCSLPSDQYCVRVTTNGSTFAWGLHLGVGMWVTERFGLSVNARIAPNAGSGTLSHALFGVRAQYRILVPRPTGLHLSAHLGLSAGQLQVQPKQESRPTDTSPVQRPWARTGLGGVQLGATLGYRFTPNVGVFATPEFYVMFPDVGLGGNFLVGLDFAFGQQGGAAAPAPRRREPEPPPVLDTDGDGIPDPSDQCPTEAEDRDDFTDEDGCPDLDDDLDTIPDTADACRLEAEDMDGFEDTNGCPDPDNDGDLVPDVSDQCPNEVGTVDNHGCPDPDRDADTVPDRVDNCPDEAGPPENRGCRVQQLVVIEGDRLEILDKVYFRTNSATIDRRSYPLLDNIASVILAHPEIGVVAVEGHTDAQGNAARNRTLSQRRAAAVRTYLTRRAHVPATRVTAQGFGPDRPIIPNATTPDELEANRRVEFRLAPR